MNQMITPARITIAWFLVNFIMVASSARLPKSQSPQDPLRTVTKKTATGQGYDKENSKCHKDPLGLFPGQLQP